MYVVVRIVSGCSLYCQRVIRLVGVGWARERERETHRSSLWWTFRLSTRTESEGVRRVIHSSLEFIPVQPTTTIETTSNHPVLCNLAIFRLQRDVRVCKEAADVQK